MKRLDLLLDVLLLVGQEFEALAIALNVGLLFEKAQRVFDRVAVFRLVDVEFALKQDRDISRRRLERLDILDQKQRLQHPGGEGVVEIVLSGQDRLLNVGFQSGADALEHLVESGEPADRQLRQCLGHVLKHPEHRAFADRAVLALKGVVFAQTLDRQLKQRILVGNEGIAIDEVIPVAKVLQPH